MIWRIFTSSSQVCTKTSFSSINQNGTSSGRCFLFFVELPINSCSSNWFLKYFSFIINTNCSEIGNFILHTSKIQEMISSSCRIHSWTTWDRLSSWHTPCFVINWHLFLSSQTSNARSEFVFFNHCIIREINWNIQQWISNEKDLISVWTCSFHLKLRVFNINIIWDYVIRLINIKSI